ncbi:MAG: hypothetical protein L3J09_07755 [Flavobacteriaceae bacterium]|nr:hypothetical protein [Flavobacteriaceae bacterium]
MKNLYILIALLFISAATFAQTDGISYQAVILNPNAQELPGVDASSTILPNTAISIRFTITNDTGSVDYQETQSTITDSFGMINLFIGEGSQTGGENFTEINWDGTPKSLEVEIDFNGGSNFETLGSQKLTFVPYAFHRDVNATGDLNIDGNTIFNGDFLVEGITTFNNDLIIEGALTLNNDLYVTGNTTFDGDALITGTLGVQAATTLDDELTVEGVTNLNNDLNITNASNTNLSGNLNVGGNTNLNNLVNIVGDTNIGSNLSVEGISNLNNNLNVNNESPTNLSGTLTVDGLTTFNNGLVIEGETIINNNLTVTGNILIEGDSEVLGNSSVGLNFRVDGITSLNDALKVDNLSPTFLTGSLNVDGVTDVNNEFNVNNNSASVLTGTLDVDGKTTINNSFSVTNEGLSYLSGILKVDGVSYLNNDLNVVGITNLEDEFNVNNASISNLSGILNVEGVSNLNNDLNVLGITNLEDEFNVNNASVSNLSGILNVEGVSNLNNDLNVVGITNLEDEFNVNNASVSNLSGILNVEGVTNLNNDVNVTGKANFADSLKVQGSTLLANLVVKGGNDIGGGAGANHIALFENTNPSNGNTADGIAIRIQGNASNKLGFRNRFVTFYGNGDYVAGRIESYDLLAGDLWESFPIPDFANLIDVFDFTQVLEWTPPTLDFDTGALPSMSGGALPSASFYRGRLPSLSIDWGDLDYSWSRGRLPSLSFNSGSFPTLNSGSLPSGDLDIGSLNLNFDNFFNPTAGANAIDDVSLMAAWGMRNGDPGFMPTGPWSIALVPVVLAAKQIARDQGVIYGSKGADYAEWLEKENPEEKYMFGEVVGVKGGKISRNTSNADQVMSISLAPIVLGNMPDEDRKDDFEKVGFMGQVPVLTLGDVEVGDYIVATGYNDGYAKALSKEEILLKDLKNIIGIAWTGSNGDKVSLINVSVGLKTNEWITIFEQQETKINDLETKINKLESLTERLEKLESTVNALGIN